MKNIFVISGRIMSNSNLRSYYHNMYVHIKDTRATFYWDTEIDTAIKFSSIKEAREWWEKNKANISCKKQTIDRASISIQKLVPYIMERL